MGLSDTRVAFGNVSSGLLYAQEKPHSFLSQITNFVLVAFFLCEESLQDGLIAGTCIKPCWMEIY